MSDLLVCVGGGGQHIALAIARMVRLGVWRRVPRVVVLDAEQTAPLNQRLLHFSAPRGQPGAAAARAHPFGRFDFKAPFEVQGLPPTFRDVFLKEKTPLAEELYELFYPEMADGVNIHVGMFAQPAVGAAMFAARAASFLDPVLTGGIQSCEKILVAGSMVGGTGAGILHLLVDYLARHRERKQKDLLGAFLLQWFSLPAEVASAANDVTLNNSANHGVDYLARHTYQRLRRTILVGANNAAGPPKANADPANDETVSLFPLLAAYGLTTIRGDTVSKDDHAVYGLTTDPGDPNCRWLLAERWNTGEEGESIGVRWKAAQVVQRAVRVIVENRAEFDGLTGTGVKDKWEKLGGGWEWGNAISSAASLAGVRRGEDLAPQVLNALTSRMAEVDFVTSWLDQVFGTPSLAGFGTQRLMDLAAAPMTKQLAFEVLASSVGPGREAFNVWHGSRAGTDGASGGLSPAAAAERIATIMEEALVRAVTTA